MKIWEWIRGGELQKSKARAEHLHRIATALAESVPLDKMANIVANECQKALGSDATCIYLLNEDFYEMIAEINCSEEFRTHWRRIPKAMFPLVQPPGNSDHIFFGPAADFKSRFPVFSGITERSGRHSVAYAPLMLDNQVIGVIGYSFNSKPTEPTDKTFLLTLVNLCAQALDRARLTEKDRAANMAKTQFLANISHEIRTPLGIIKGFADMLMETQSLTGVSRFWAETIQKNASQLVGIVGSVLDISKIEAGRIEVEKISFSLDRLLDDVKETAQFKVKDLQDVNLKFFWQELPKIVQSDPTRLKQILNNLLDNAIKFTKCGTVQMDVIYLYSSGYLECVISDTGIGISKESQSKIFEAFMQGDQTTCRRFGGTGLGLSISRRLAEVLGGDLTLISSIPGKGSKFLLRIPLEPVQVNEEPKPLPLRAVSEFREEAILHGMRVLVVEDSVDNQGLISHVLQKAGARVDFASDGQEGVERALSGNYDVVLMDIQMPHMDGFQAVSLLRTQGYRKAVAALTAHALQSERQRSHDAGFDDYLTKPIDRGILVNTVHRLAHNVLH